MTLVKDEMASGWCRTSMIVTGTMKWDFTVLQKDLAQLQIYREVEIHSQGRGQAEKITEKASEHQV